MLHDSDFVIDARSNESEYIAICWHISHFKYNVLYFALPFYFTNLNTQRRVERF